MQWVRLAQTNTSCRQMSAKIQYYSARQRQQLVLHLQLSLRQTAKLNAVQESQGN